MVFDYVLKDLDGRVIRIGQIHVEGSPMFVNKLYAEALVKLGNWLAEHSEGREARSITLTIAHG